MTNIFRKTRACLALAAGAALSLALALATTACLMDERVMSPKTPPLVEFSSTVASTDATRADIGYFIPNTGDDPGGNIGKIPAEKAFGVWAWHHVGTDVPKVYEDDFANVAVTRDVDLGADDLPGGTGENADKDTYTYGDPALWPTGTDRLSFVAYYPHGVDELTAEAVTPAAGDDPSIRLTYVTPVSTDEHIDVMYAAKAATSAPASDDPSVKLWFRHALSRVTLSALASGFDTGIDVAITDIEMLGVRPTATLTVTAADTDFGDNSDGTDAFSNLPEWILSTETAKQDITFLENGNIPVGATEGNLLDAGGDALLIPQSLTGATLHITATVTGAADKRHYYIPLAGVPDLEMNHTYRLVVKLTPLAGEVETTVLSWGDGGLGDYIEPGQHKLEVNKSVFEFGPEEATHTDVLKVTSDLPWSISTIRYTGGSGWLSFTPPSGTGGPNGTTKTTNVTLTVAANPNFDKREAKFDIVTKSNNTERIRKTITVTQRKKERAKIYAAPGVVGIKKSYYERVMADPSLLDDEEYRKNALTLKGSSTYASAPAIEDMYIKDIMNGTDLQGLETEEVYTVYFKWGSMVAMIGGEGDTWSKEDVVWVNKDMDMTLITGDTGSAAADGYYSDFTKSDNDGSISTSGKDRDFIFGMDNSNPEHRSKGWGDICMELTEGRWLIPQGNPWRLSGETNAPAWISGTTTNTVNINSGTATASSYSALVSTTSKIFLPTAGYRNTSPSQVYSQGSYGLYWSSTAFNTNSARNLLFSRGNVDTFRTDNYAHGYAVRCVRAPSVATVLTVSPETLEWKYNEVGDETVTVESDGAWTATIDDGDDMSNFTVTAGDGEDGGTVSGSITGGNGTITGVGKATFIVKPTSTNTTTSPREAKIIVTLDNPDPDLVAADDPAVADKTVTVTQHGLGMYAAPGVIGYTNDGRLTLNGSKEYKGTLVDPAVTPRTDGITTLENETVYVAYFKWGSLIATSSQPARADGAFSDGDIIAAPTTDDGYKGLAQLKIDVSGMTPGTTAWGGILYRTGTPTSGDLGWSLDMASGLGDPCDYYFGDRDGDAYNTPSDWRVPAGGSGTSGGWYKARTEGAPFGTSAINQTNWKLTTGSGNGAMWIDNANDPYKQFPIKGAVAGKSGAQDWSMFLPAAGYRNDSNGQVSSQGTNGCYWSSTAYSSTLGYGLGFSSSRVNPSGNDDRSSGFSVRCVRP